MASLLVRDSPKTRIHPAVFAKCFRGHQEVGWFDLSDFGAEITHLKCSVTMIRFDGGFKCFDLVSFLEFVFFCRV